jgi:Family of unknown function (DUF6093)
VSRETVIARAQAAALQGMVDTCTVTRRTDVSTNPETGVVAAIYASIYTGPCKVQQRAGVARPETIGEAEVFLSRLELHVPVSVVGIASDDLVAITASPHDADLVGRVFHVRELAHKTWASARRYSMIEVTS